MIEGVLIEDITRYADERGFFNEIARSDTLRPIAQVSHGLRHTGIANGWHIHMRLCEWMYVLTGEARIVLRDCRIDSFVDVRFIYRADPQHEVPVSFGRSTTPNEYMEVHAGEHHPKAVYIPAGVAHGYKIIQGPCHMIYLASHVYDPSDEGRIEPHRWPVRWTRDVAAR